MNQRELEIIKYALANNENPVELLVDHYVEQCTPLDFAREQARRIWTVYQTQSAK